MKQLIKRGYNRISLIKLCKTIGKVEKDSLLTYKLKRIY